MVMSRIIAGSAAGRGQRTGVGNSGECCRILNSCLETLDFGCGVPKFLCICRSRARRGVLIIVPIHMVSA
ncbi:hypothetical protein PHAVU_002G007000 [Phaseolus vulgaris]|uniref:Uncharacterized protein n=1 Tax=Phaseolus vulgaris TaxID=3885 RepID=V7CIF8_PHAVU|nr:hypothetical protein PHAVU_002G007000g [Phaseolus vulgaris]ESW28661.1 hypothetical protein PHAVU_002G007000g [Phaseolus vulgaris]